MLEYHGMTGHKLHAILKSMLDRCNNTAAKPYYNYGGRGITVCEDWTNSPSLFFGWAFLNGYREGKSIDRIDNDAGYSPSNCRWTNDNVQRQNTRLLSPKNTSGYRGVHFHKKTKKWIVRKGFNDKTTYIGLFADKDDAARAYNQFCIDNNIDTPLNPV